MLTGQVRYHMFEAPHQVIWPGVALDLAVYGTNVFGDALRDTPDPRLRGGAGALQRQRRPPQGAANAPGATNGASTMRNT